MAQSVKFLPCHHEGLSLIPRIDVKMADVVGVLVIPELEAKTAGSHSLWPDSLTNLMSPRSMRDLSQRTWAVFLRIRTKVVYWSPHACLHKCTYNRTHMNMHGNIQKKNTIAACKEMGEKGQR